MATRKRENVLSETTDECFVTASHDITGKHEEEAQARLKAEKIQQRESVLSNETNREHRGNGIVIVQGLVEEKICRHYRNNTVKRHHTEAVARPSSFSTQAVLPTNSLLFDLNSRRNGANALEERRNTLYHKRFTYDIKSVLISRNEDHTFDSGHVQDNSPQKMALSGRGRNGIKRADRLNMRNHETARTAYSEPESKSGLLVSPGRKKRRTVDSTSLCGVLKE